MHSRNNFPRTKIPACPSLYLMLSSLLLVGCSMMYIPNSQNTPVFKGRHDFVVTGSYSNYQLAYAPTSNLGLIVNGYYRNSKYFNLDDGKNYFYRGTARLVEGGIGYFKKNHHTTFSIYGGWGKGYCSIYYDQSYVGTVGHFSHYNRVFFQPNVSWGNDVVQCIVSTRLSFVNLYDFSGAPLIRGVSQNNTPFFLEPAFTFQAKLGRVYFHAQLQGSIATIELSDAYAGYTPYQTMPVINVGFVVHLRDLISNSEVP